MPSRRIFLLGTLSIASGLGIAVGYREWKLPPRLPKSIDLEAGQISLTPYVVIDHEGIKLIAPRAEMGQGIHTTLAALVAEELDVQLDSVMVIHGPPSELFSNTVAFGPPRYPGRVHGHPTQFTGGHARGLAYVLSSGAATAQVIEIKSTTNGIKIVKAYAAVDFGYALDPRNIISQVEGSLLYGLTAAIMGEITVNDGVVDQLNFHKYGMLGMSDSPPVEVKIMESKESIYGAGESASSGIAPALGNAIFALTGQRLRELPFRKFIDFA